jgi:cysteinyl-tRNA synthetase
MGKMSQKVKLTNTLTRQKDELKTLEPGVVKIYNCGLTVYSQPHIGNWTSYIYWDILHRLLRYIGYDVKRIQNITDVGHLTSDEDSGDDKMEKGAKREGITAWEVAEKYINIADHEGYELLDLLKPKLIRATAYIPQQIDFVQELEKRGYTYTIPDDGVYFDTSKLPDYGKLARLDVSGLKSGARVENTGKRNITDFAVWKFSPAGQKRDMEWGSPWGTGFPGWHLECSVMARENLGDQIDIHTGGIDHIPVHHTNEIAQTEAITGKQFSQIWLHANHLKINGVKISKSLGNVINIQDIIDKNYDIQAFKVLVLMKHYSTEGNFTWETLDAASSWLKTVRNSFSSIFRLEIIKADTSTDTNPELETLLKSSLENIVNALADDLDTPKAMVILRETADNFADFSPTDSSLKLFEDYAQEIESLLGINILDKARLTREQQSIFDQRKAAREAKNWQLSDELRDKLAEMGIGVNDFKDKTSWHRL